MVRGKLEVHACFLESKDDAGKSKATCKYCGKIYVPNITRQKKHILHECKLVPALVRARYAPEFPVPSTSTPSTSSQADPDDPGDGDRMSVDNSGTATTSAASTSSLQGADSSHSSGGGGVKRKASMDRFVDHTGPQEKKMLDASFARAMYASGMPFSAFSTLYWKNFFKMLRPSWEPPTPYFLRGSLLDAEYNICKAANSEKVKNAAALGIMTDSYTNIRSESVIDILVTTPQPVLYKQIFRGATRETGQFVGGELLKVIEEIGPDKFWLLITDNAANMQVAWRLIQEKYPHITAAGCASHCWDLLFQDLIKLINEIDKYYKNARSIVRTVKKRSNVLAVFNIKQKEKYGSKSVTLKLPGKTRWAGAVILLNSLLKNKSALEETVLDETLDVDRNIRKCVLDSKFWEKIKCISNVLTPIHASITLIESNKALLSDVYFLHTKINQCVTENLSQLRLRSNEKRNVHALLLERKEFTIKPIHMATYMLDPRYMGEGLTDGEVAEAIVFISQMAGHMGLNEGAVIANLGEFRTKVGFFGLESIIESSRKLHPAVWWRGVCSTQPIATLAAILLSMPPTAAECERRWSDHGFIHDKARNRLLNPRVTKLVTARASLLANLNKGKNLEPLSATEMASYFESYAATIGSGANADGEDAEKGNEGDEDESDAESSDGEDSEWEVNCDSDHDDPSDSEQEPPVQQQHQRNTDEAGAPTASSSRTAQAGADANTNTRTRAGMGRTGDKDSGGRTTRSRAARR